MKYVNKLTGIIYNVTNEALIPSYEADERFNAVADDNASAKEEKSAKTTKSKR